MSCLGWWWKQSSYRHASSTWSFSAPSCRPAPCCAVPALHVQIAQLDCRRLALGEPCRKPSPSHARTLSQSKPLTTTCKSLRLVFSMPPRQGRTCVHVGLQVAILQSAKTRALLNAAAVIRALFTSTISQAGRSGPPIRPSGKFQGSLPASSMCPIAAVTPIGISTERLRRHVQAEAILGCAARQDNWVRLFDIVR